MGIRKRQRFLTVGPVKTYVRDTVGSTDDDTPRLREPLYAPAFELLQVGGRARLLRRTVAAALQHRRKNKVRSEGRNVLQKEQFIPQRNMQEQDQVLMKLAHIAHMRDDGQTEFLRQQAHR